MNPFDPAFAAIACPWLAPPVATAPRARAGALPGRPVLPWMPPPARPRPMPPPPVDPQAVDDEEAWRADVYARAEKLMVRGNLGWEPANAEQKGNFISNEHRARQENIRRAQRQAEAWAAAERAAEEQARWQTPEAQAQRKQAMENQRRAAPNLFTPDVMEFGQEMSPLDPRWDGSTAG